MAMAFVELAIGLTFIYLVLSIACSAIVEWYAQYFGLRGRQMRRGLLRLVEDRWFYLRIINHPSLAASYRNIPGRPRPPSYVSPESFATALVDVLIGKASKLDPASGLDPTAHPPQEALIKAARICASAGFATGYAVLPLIASAKSEDEARSAIGKWYSATMDRVSGWYKQDTQWRLVVVGFFVAVALNIDSIAITKTLLHSSSVRTALADAATLAAPGLAPDAQQPSTNLGETLKGVLAQMDVLGSLKVPVGYECLSDEKVSKEIRTVVGGCWLSLLAETWLSLPLRVAGWLITAYAVSFGAQFWFEALNRFINIRGAGAKPARETTASASS
jgi:hypothetical protein